jgi:hypothetical protein
MKPPVLYSRLGAIGQVTTPVIGSAGSEIGSPSYASVKFGNGLSTLTGGGSVGLTFPFSYTGKHTFDFWYKPNFDYNAGTGFLTLLHIPSISSGYLRIGFDKSTTDKFFTYVPDGTGAAKFVRWDQGAFSADDLIHIAWVVDKDGIDGSSNTQRFYVNGSAATSIAGDTTEDGTIYSTSVGSLTQYIGKFSTANQTQDGGIDNYKEYDYAKIDQSDREDERGGLNDQRVFI